jgi:oligopeptide transport system ATP-binding protein
LLMDLQERFRLTYLLIAHDLRVVEHVCTHAGVMYIGRLVELGATAQIFTAPRHPYTQALLSAVPEPNPDMLPQRTALDPTTFVRDAPLREVSPGHFAAI